MIFEQSTASALAIEGKCSIKINFIKKRQNPRDFLSPNPSPIVTIAG
jgi:hypothetical protein